MKINRNNLCIGLLTKSTRLSLSYPRKILFSYDRVSRTGYDVINKIDYNTYKKKKECGFYITCGKPLDETLKNLGYPEELEEVHLARIMEEDFGKIFVSSGIMYQLHSQTMDELTDLYMTNDYKLLKREFTTTKDEEKVQLRQQHTKRRKWL